MADAKKPPVKSAAKKTEPEKPELQAPSLFAPTDQPADPSVKNEAKLTDIWAPLRLVIKDETILSQFAFKGSDLAVDKTIAFYRHVPSITPIAVDTEGNFYDVTAIEDDKFNTITREEALRGILPEEKSKPESFDTIQRESETKAVAGMPNKAEPESPLDTAAKEIAVIQSQPLPEQPSLPESEVVEAEFTNEQALALRDASLGGTVDKLSMLQQQGQQILDARIDILRRLRKASIMMTFNTDWVLFRNKDTGQEMAYLQDCGCERIQGLWGIEITDISPFEKIEGENGAFAFIIKGSGRSKFLGGEGVQDMEGVRYSDDPFFKKTTGMRLTYYVRKSARTNLDGNILRTIAGLSSVPIEELKACGLDTEKCHHGRGYESAGERAGADVVIKEAGIPASQHPKCEKCGGDMKFIPGKDTPEKKYDAFFACKKPQGACDGKTVKAAGWIAKVKQSQPKAVTEAGTAATPTTENSSGWKCEKSKQGTIESMSKLLANKHQWGAEQFESNLLKLVSSDRVLFPGTNVTVESLNNEQAAKYIAHLSETINGLAAKS